MIPIIDRYVQGMDEIIWTPDVYTIFIYYWFRTAAILRVIDTLSAQIVSNEMFSLHYALMMLEIGIYSSLCALKLPITVHCYVKVWWLSWPRKMFNSILILSVNFGFRSLSLFADDDVLACFVYTVITVDAVSHRTLNSSALGNRPPTICPPSMSER